MPHAMRRHALTLLASCAMLSSCFWQASPTKLYQQIQSGQATQALSTLESQLADDPTNPVLNTLALHATLTRCATSCSPAQFTAMAGYLRYAKEPVKLDESTLLNPATILAQAAPAIAALPNQPQPFLSFMAITPPSVQAAVNNAMFSAPLTQLREGKPAQASPLLLTFSTHAKLPRTAQAFAKLAHGLATSNPATVASSLVTLRTFPMADASTSPLPSTALQLLPHFLITHHPSGTTIGTIAAALAFSPTLTGFKITNLLTPAALKPIAAEVNQLASRNTFTAEEKLQLTNLSLQLNPAQPDLWRTFLPQATTYLQANPSPTAQPMAGLNLTTLTAGQQEQVVTELFTLVGKLSKAGQSVVPLLTQLSTLQLTGPTRTKLEKLIQSSLETAIANQNLPEVIAYARFKPQLAQANRTGITPLIVEAIRTDLQTQQFSQATAHAALLTQLGISFNLDTLMLQELEKSFTSQKLTEQLSADTPALLLQPVAAVQVELGPLWDYLQSDYFSTKPAQLNTVLRTLVANAQGTWGTPTAMARLASHFNEEDFPAADQQTYLVKAIATALMEDDTMSPTQLLATAGQLQALYPSLPLAPVIESTLARSTTIESSQELWQSASPRIRQVIAVTRPQFAALMRGITAWQAGSLTMAAQHFGSITQSTYAAQLQPYFDQLQQQLTSVQGTYLVNSPAIPTTLVRVSAPALQGATSGSLAMVSVQLTNALGTVPGSGLQPNHAGTQSATLTAPLNFTNGTLTFTAEARQLASSPLPFNSTFGAITGATFGANTLTLTSGANGITATKLSTNPQAVLWPQGRWLFGTPISTMAGTATLLPRGSLLTVQPTLTANAQGVHPVTGSLWHPALSQPQSVEGTFNPTTGLTALTFRAPLPQGGLTTVQARCHLLPANAICGVHVTGLTRHQFGTLIGGAQTKESRTALLQLISTTSVAAPITPLSARLSDAPTSITTAAPKLLFTTMLSAPTSSPTVSISTAVTPTTPAPAPATTAGGFITAPTSTLLPAPAL